MPSKKDKRESQVFTCPKCGAEIRVFNPTEGKFVTCRKCGTMSEIIKKRRKYDLIPLEESGESQDISDIEFSMDLD